MMWCDTFQTVTRSLPLTSTAQNAPPVLRQYPRRHGADLQRPAISKATIDWEAPKEEITSWQAQWNDFLDAIRQNKPINQAKRAALSNLADIMGRAAIHMGKIITWEEAMASQFQFCPNIETLTYDSAPPIQADKAGRYPVPIPGEWVEIYRFGTRWHIPRQNPQLHGRRLPVSSTL